MKTILCIEPITQKAKELYFKPGFIAESYNGDSGVDLYFPDNINISQPTTLIRLGVKTTLLGIKKNDDSVSLTDRCKCFVQRMPYFIVPRSSIYKTPLRQSNSIGIIDAYYTGELCVPVDNIGIIMGVSLGYKIEAGTRLFQIIQPNLKPFDEIRIVDSVDNINITCPSCNKGIELSISSDDRGSKGFGSTGK